MPAHIAATRQCRVEQRIGKSAPSGAVTVGLTSDGGVARHLDPSGRRGIGLFDIGYGDDRQQDDHARRDQSPKCGHCHHQGTTDFTESGKLGWIGVTLGTDTE